MVENAVSKEWIIMLYLAGDNDLSEDMAGTLRELNALGVDIKDVAILAFYDSAYPQISSRHIDFTPKLTSIPSGISSLPYMEEIGESDAADPESVVNFVKWCDKRYTSNKYALFLSGHSDGFQGITLFRDDDAKSAMTLRDLREGLEEVTRIIDQKLQILGFDGCVMSSVEIAYEFRNVTDFLLSSQGFIPDAGLNYAEILRKWNPVTLVDKTPEEVIANIVKVYLEDQKGFDIGGRSVTLSGCRLGSPNGERPTPLENLENEINVLSKMLFNYFSLEEIFKTAMKDLKEGEEPGDKEFKRLLDGIITQQILKKILLSSQWNSQTLLFDQAIDIKDFCNLLISECDLLTGFVEYINILSAPPPSDTPVTVPDEGGESPESPIDCLTNPYNNISIQCENIIGAYNKVVLHIDAKPTGSEYKFATGLSLFFPWSDIGFGISKKSYNKTAFCNLGKDKQWNKFVEMYLKEITMRDSAEGLIQFLNVMLTKTRSTILIQQVIDVIEKNKQKYNTTYDRRGMGDDTYLKYFGKFKNLPSFKPTDTNPTPTPPGIKK